MRTILRSKVTLLFLTIAVLLAIPAIAAIADTITADPDPATIAVVENNVNKAPGGTGTAKVWLAVDDNTTDPVNGCNANSSNPVAITLSSNDSDVTFDSTGTTANPASLTGCDAVNGKQIGFKVSSSATGPFPKTVTVTATGSGGRTPSGNIPAYTSDTFTITITPPADATAPDTNILTNPNDPTNSTSANFTYSSTEANSTFECSLDGGSYASCPSSGKSYSSLSAGSHTFSVRATDEAGNTDATPASYTWFVDTVAPDTSITANPNDPTNSTSASFSFSGTDNHTTTANLDFECSLDGGAYTSCTSPKSYSNLGEGSHTFSVRAKDEAGNTDATPASYTWFVDTTAPTVTVNGFTDGDKFTVGATLPTVTCTVSDPNGVQNASPTPVKTDARNANGVGTVTYTCTGTDNAGNTTTVSHKFFVIYGFSGFLQPINDTAHMISLGPDVSTFKAGSTVPVKFYLTDANGNRVQAGSAQWITPQKGSATTQAVDESVFTDPATSGTLYKYDATAQQYIYNWGTKGVTGGFYYKIGVKLDDGQTYYTYISLR